MLNRQASMPISVSVTMVFRLKGFSLSDVLSSIVRFGRFELDLTAGELYSQQQRIPLQEQPFQLLRMLVDRPGELLTRDDIRRKLWPNGTTVEFDDSINTAIKKLRLALGDSAEVPRYVETVARRGYRLMVPVFRGRTNRPGNAQRSANRSRSVTLRRRSRQAERFHTIPCWRLCLAGGR